MSLKGKILLSIFLFMVLVFVLLTVNLLVDLSGRATLEVERNAHLVSLLTLDWMKAEYELQGLYSEMYWPALNRRLYDSALVSEWIIVLRKTDGGLEVKASSSHQDLSRTELHRFTQVFEDRKTKVFGNSAYVILPSRFGETFAAKFTLKEEALPAYDVGAAIRSVVVVMVIGIVLILLNTYVLLNRWMFRPLDELARASTRIGMGDFSKTLPEPATIDEMGRTYQAFNLMLRKLQEHHQRLMGDLEKSREDLKNTQRKLVVAQRLSSTGTLAAGIAHEINNPLSGLINIVLALRDKNLDEGKRREYVDLIVEGLYRIKSTVDKILQFAPRPSSKRAVDVREIVQKAAALVEHKLKQKGIRVVWSSEEKLPHIKADPAEMQQVFLNVLLNATDAIGPAGGAIEISVSRQEEFVRVTVKDDGCGMDEQQLQGAFVPFFTTKAEGQGTGLGLPIARSIVEDHGGDMYLESEKGKGTSVHILLPVAKEESAAPFVGNTGS